MYMCVCVYIYIYIYIYIYREREKFNSKDSIEDSEKIYYSLLL